MGKEEREDRFTGAVEDIVLNNRGCCLIPVFALGRAQVTIHSDTIGTEVVRKFLQINQDIEF